ncbi:4'-phosphopantetheinyl transferase family protein [Blastochloris viridis]|uniref:4'-phosphopantetheinyl transferase n=1 Tax=Blastochloris viridis TaxID=1079 RepID=A0A182D2C9_BLAVI|nr:4'-phosphopantetheinyl transferase superfamily protein [Blastochloris viridis]BAR99137.1 4'-phosphopantetheinyl transferase [Blastochloris viridis]
MCARRTPGAGIGPPRWASSRDAGDPGPIGAGEVQVWLIDLDAVTDVALGQDLAILGPQERGRAAAFATPTLRARHVAAHGALRRILSVHLGVPAATLAFCTSAWGRPFLSDTSRPFDFSLSHSGRLAVLAVSAGVRVGVDLERLCPDPPYEIAAAAFSAAERTLLARLAQDERAAAFYALWTRKEALAKGIGCGLDMDLTGLDVSPGLRLSGRPAPGRPRPRWSGGSSGEGSWRFHAMPDIPGFAAALALGGRARHVICRLYDRSLIAA